jgi:hypothetical protein
MLLRRSILDGIRSGSITLAFRRWRRPTVRTGGTLRTAIGELQIDSVDAIALDYVTPAEAKQAGYASLDSLKEELQRFDGQVYRIAFGTVSIDRRLELRRLKPAAEEMEAILAKLANMDRRAPRPWTAATLRLIDQQPGVRAGDLADQLGMERLPFKSNVRKLKEFGLTISLEIGYELSARGRVVLQALATGIRA